MPSSRSLTQDAGERPCEEPPVDLVHLARHTLGDAELEREVLLLFVSQAGIYLDRLKEARDGQAWRHAAHTIKGAARGVGAWKVARRAEDAEQVKPDPECGRCREAVASIEREIDAASRFIRTLFSEH
jgi:HPt (histidine-containing phosphotransfer) domain-containing protein